VTDDLKMMSLYGRKSHINVSLLFPQEPTSRFMFLNLFPRTQIVVCCPFSVKNLASPLHHLLVLIGRGIYSRHSLLSSMLEILFLRKKGQPSHQDTQYSVLPLPIETL
jgi:hypothetical protein